MCVYTVSAIQTQCCVFNPKGLLRNSTSCPDLPTHLHIASGDTFLVESDGFRTATMINFRPACRLSVMVHLNICTFHSILRGFHSLVKLINLTGLLIGLASHVPFTKPKFVHRDCMFHGTQYLQGSRPFASQCPSTAAS